MTLDGLGRQPVPIKGVITGLNSIVRVNGCLVYVVSHAAGGADVGLSAGRESGGEE